MFERFKKSRNGFERTQVLHAKMLLSLSQPCEFKASGADLIFVCFFHHKLHGCMPWGEVCLLP